MGSRLTPDGVEDHYFAAAWIIARDSNRDEWTVASWMDDQGFAEYDQGRREWLEILLQAGVTEELVVDALEDILFATLAYDLDQFRRLVFDPVFLEAYDAYDIKAEALEDLRTDNLALLQFSYRLLPQILSPQGAAGSPG